MRTVAVFVPQLVLFLVILLIGWLIAKGLRRLTASVFIVGLGVIAALSQMGIAIAVTLPVLVTVLATVGGILVVGVGGGLIRPMQQRWENWLSRAEAEAPRARAQAGSTSEQAHAQAFERGREDAARPAAPSATETDPVGRAGEMRR
jgi:hypothetical protein